MRYWTIYLTLWKNSVVREMGFKLNFLLWIVVEMLWFALQLGFITVIYQHTDRIATWTKWEVVLLMGASHFIQQVYTALFLTNITQLSEFIRTGKLDFMLLLPVNTRFIVSVRQVDLGGFINAASAVAVMAYALIQLNLSVTTLQVIEFLLLAVCGVFVHYSLMLLLACSSFWTVRGQGVVWGYYNLFNIARLPDAAFQGAFKVIFTYVLPILLVANVPAKLLILKLDSVTPIFVLLAMSLGSFLVSEGAWRFALRRYTSASS